MPRGAGQADPTFKLEPQERDQLLEELLPWCVTWRAPLTSSTHTVRDCLDQVFLDLAWLSRGDRRSRHPVPLS
jgi:hypothetical protein